MDDGRIVGGVESNPTAVVLMSWTDESCSHSPSTVYAWQEVREAIWTGSFRHALYKTRAMHCKTPAEP